MPPHDLESTKARLAKELGTILNRTLSAEDETRPLHELGVDSMSLVELLVAIEREFGVRLMETKLASEDLRTLLGLAAAIQRA